MTTYPTYRIVRQKDLSYTVEIVIGPETFPTTIAGFGNEDEAEAWIAERRARIAPRRRLR
jgi:hypothetical protein